MGYRKEEESGSNHFRHTQYAVYTTALVTALAVGYDSCQGIVQKYHINKKWFYLYGIMSLFAYLYVRPLIRRRLGSASTGYINWTTVYTVWLCAAVFYHLPSLESLGLDIKADLSILMTIFLLSCVLLGILVALYGLLNSLWNGKRSTYMPPSSKDLFSVALLNSMSLALACSTYYSFCGNSPRIDGMEDERSGDVVRGFVCGHLLKPLPAGRHPIYSPWMIYGELENNTLTSQEPVNMTNGIISPVFTTWLTLFALLVCNSIADLVSNSYVRSAYFTDSKNLQEGLDSHRNTLTPSGAHHGSSRRGKSLDLKRDQMYIPESAYKSFQSIPDLGSLWEKTPLSRNSSLDALVKTMSSVGAMWNPASLDSINLKNIFSKDDLYALINKNVSGKIMDRRRYASALNVVDPDAAAIVGTPIPKDSKAPAFLPMFPWYSGTSADLLKTIFDLVVSLKVFVGRFDMRTMLSAISMDGSRAEPSYQAWVPREGDGYTFEHLAEKEEIWIDFCADTGDGGNSTYSVARCLAAQRVVINVTEDMAANLGCSQGIKVLPRGNALIHGGDLAYPNPTDETYEQRLFEPYQDAFPTPQHVHPGHLVVNKPDLPAEFWGRLNPDCPHVDKGSRAVVKCQACQKAAALKAYDGPSAFLIPGNHDWIDGLETFQRHIIHRGWMGGWLLPQEKSYFALKLPHGWWLLALDLALVEDIDMSQYQYFAKIAEERMEPGDAAILVTHCPQWLVDWFWGVHTGKNLRQLIRGPLRGKVRLRLAGDLHFYMRHSFRTYGSEGMSFPPSVACTPAGGSPLAGGSPPESRIFNPSNNYMTLQMRENLATKLDMLASEGTPDGSPTTTDHNNHWREIPSKPIDNNLSSRSEISGFQSPLGSSPPSNWWPGMRSRTPNKGGSPPELETLGGSFSEPAAEWEAPPHGWILNEAEHLVVCGSGGAFLHPTHVFSYSRFRPIHDPSAGPIHTKALGERRVRRSHPSSSSLYSMRKMDVPKPAGGEYQCIACFPTTEDSLSIGRSNLHKFRHTNSRFDVIGGILYYLLVISALPRCSEVAAVFNASSVPEAVYLFFEAMMSTCIYIFSKTYISCVVFAILFFIVFGFARGGGVGAISGVAPAARRRPEYRGFALAVKTRMGGLAAQIAYALVHAFCHLFSAIGLLLLLELGVETVIRYEGVGTDGYHSLYRWYRAFEAENFPDPADLRGILSRVTFSLYPNAIKWLFALFDVPETIAVSRTAACAADGTFAALTRLQTLGYYIGVLLYFWVLATPTVGFLFGIYLYLSGNWLHVHYDESFSALQVEDRKAFLRFHIDKSGSLDLFALGLKEVPKEWREDPHWKRPGGGGRADVSFSHEVRWPSKWIPVRRAGRTNFVASVPPEASLELVDYVHIGKREC